MTARQPPRPNGLNANGTGRGMKKLSKPPVKKRGANAANQAQTLIDNRAKYLSLSSIPAAQITESVDPNKPLTERAKLFVKYWAQGESITSASNRAGYGDGATMAYRVARYPQAIALYNEEKRLYEEASQMTRKRVMDGLMEGIEMAKLVSEPHSVITGWKTIGQMCGYFEPVKVNVRFAAGEHPTMKQMNRLTDAELLKVIAEGVSADLLRIENGSDD